MRNLRNKNVLRRVAKIKVLYHNLTLFFISKNYSFEYNSFYLVRFHAEQVDAQNTFKFVKSVSTPKS